jgi:hypothetical protein
MNKFILIFNFIIIIITVYYYKITLPNPVPTTPVPTTPVPTTPVPTTPVPTTPVPTINKSIIDAVEGEWPTFQMHGNDYGPVNLLYIGDNIFYIDGEKKSATYDEKMRYLSIDPYTLECTFVYLQEGTFYLAIVNNKAISISRFDLIVNLQRPSPPTSTSTSTSPPTPSPTPEPLIDPSYLVGEWQSYYKNREFGPVTITSLGNNNFYIDSPRLTDEEGIHDNLRYLYINPHTLNAYLPQNYNDFIGKLTVIDVNGVKKGIALTPTTYYSLTRYRN